MPVLDAALAEEVSRTRHAREQAERLRTDASAQTRRTAQHLKEQGMTQRDISALLGIMTQQGLTSQQIRDFLVQKSGRAEAEFPQPVRVFFYDLEKRLLALREADRVLVLDGPDPYLLTELAHDASLRAIVHRLKSSTSGRSARAAALVSKTLATVVVASALATLRIRNAGHLAILVMNPGPPPPSSGKICGKS